MSQRRVWLKAMAESSLRTLVLVAVLSLLLGGASCVRDTRGAREKLSAKSYLNLERERERGTLVRSMFDAPRYENASWAWPHGFLGPQFMTKEGDLELMQEHLAATVETQHRTRDTQEAQRKKTNGLQQGKGESGKEWFGFLPDFVGTVMPNSVKGHVFEGHCYKEIGFEMDRGEAVGTELHLLFELFEYKGQGLIPCVETLVLFSGSGFKFLNFVQGGPHKVSWSTVELTEDEKWYLYNRGLHVFLFRKGSWESIVEDVYHTASLFVPFGTQDVNRFSAQDNIDFLTSYQQIKPLMVPRTPEQQAKPTSIDPSLIESGDFMGIIRLDGLDTMLAWAIGGTTGHTAVALRKPVTGQKQGELHICESTAKDAYWDTDGIQCTPYDEWVRKAMKAEHHVVWAPLSPENRKRFDEVAAWKWFETVKGLEYGYQNLLFSWIDTVDMNYPCIPPNYDRCISWPLLEVLSILFDRTSTVVAQKIWLQAFNKRVGTEGLHTLELYKTFLSRKPKDVDATKYLAQLPVIPEQDDWEYHMFPESGPTQTGPSMVCSVFVCRVWKEAGIFHSIGDNVNCGEFTPYDVYKLKIFDEAYPFPPECSGKGQSSQVCQLMGKYTLHLNDYNTVDLHSHMAQTCPSFPPKYERENAKC